jgi:hypothetical protein
MSLNLHNFPALPQLVEVVNLPTSVSIDNAQYDASNNLKVVNNTKGVFTLFNGSQTGVNGVSFVCDISNKNVQNLTFYGNCNGPTVITVQFSNNNTTYYDSMYSYTVSSAGSFGFSLNASPNYIRLKSTSDVACNAFINYI